MTPNDNGFSHSAWMRSFNKFFVFKAKGLPSDDTRHIEPVHSTNGNEDKKNIATKKGHQKNYEKLAEEFNSSYYYVERNANPKILFLDLLLKTNELINLK